MINAYLTELDFYKQYDFDTIYFGGGTPTLMTEKLLESILNKVNCKGEISMEANPNSISYEKLKNFKTIGVNRLSIGIQSLKDDDLKMLGRIHNREEGIQAIKNAEKIFKDKYSIDLIYSRPNQNITDWSRELEQGIALSPYHISAYQLIIERGTRFSRWKIQEQSEDNQILLYEKTREIMEKNGLNFYEISNYAKLGYECQHNLVYWKNGEWLGIGAGAHSRINKNGKRYAMQNLKHPQEWLKKVSKKGNGISVKTKLNIADITNEKVLMGLRTKEGIDITGMELNNIAFLEKRKINYGKK
ncbi:MAG: hypothetical protein Ta2D_03480 [Rickettsiales bacterium]|nr:MAG: hypothetical protein Ta2D_03480 [Rickettsiales bacterium]